MPPVQQQLSDHRHCDPIATNKAFFPVSHFRAGKHSRTTNRDFVSPQAPITADSQVFWRGAINTSAFPTCSNRPTQAQLTAH